MLNLIQKKEPYPLELEPRKKYYYCPCGRSETGLLCDGAHKGTDQSSILIVSDEAKVVYLCACRKSNALPYCDGAHVNP